MSKRIGLGLWIGLALSVAAAPAALAADTELDFELSDELSHNTTTGTATAYSWRIQAINMGFDIETRDGVWADGRSYVKFTGTDASPNGHCLQIIVKPGLSTPPDAVDLYVKDHATNKFIYSFAPDGSHAIRLWINKNTGAAGSTLPWTLYVLPGNVGFGGDLNLDIRRIELGKSACATNPGGDPWLGDGTSKWPWATIEGNSAAYTVTTGHF